MPIPYLTNPNMDGRIFRAFAILLHPILSKSRLLSGLHFLVNLILPSAKQLIVSKLNFNKHWNNGKINATTAGCGKKRSDETMATLVDLNSEPAVEQLSRQILSEAKLWEAIQEARMELLNRKHQQHERIPVQPLPLTGIRKRTQYSYT